MTELDVYCDVLTQMGFHAERIYSKYRNTFNDVTVYSNRWKGLFDIHEDTPNGCFVNMWVPIDNTNIKKVLTRFNLKYIASTQDKYDGINKLFKITLRE